MRITGIVGIALIAALGGCATSPRGGEKDWYTAWATAHNARAATPAMSGRTVRMILLPNIQGNALRVKLENTMGEAPVTFSGAFVGVAGEGAAVRPDSTVRLTFNGQNGLTLAPGQGAYSDAVAFNGRPSRSWR